MIDQHIQKRQKTTLSRVRAYALAMLPCMRIRYSTVNEARLALRCSCTVVHPNQNPCALGPYENFLHIALRLYARCFLELLRV